MFDTLPLRAGMDLAIVASAILAARAARGLWSAPEADGPRPGDRPLAWWWFLAVCGLLLLNQVAFAVYVRAAWGGDPTPIAQYCPPGWFLIVDGPLIAALAERASGSPLALEILSLSVLRINALLELPFALTAYLAAAWLLEPGAARALGRRDLWAAACLGWTATFCLIEIELLNPWTGSDLIARATSCALCLAAREVWAPAPASAPGSAARPADLLGGGLAVLGVALLSGVVVTMAYLALVYDLAEISWLGWLLGPAVGALAILFRMAGRDGRLGRADAGARPTPIEALVGTGAWFGILFFPASMPIRYQWPHPVSAGALGAITTIAVALGVRRALRLRGPMRPGDLHRLGASLVAGIVLAASDGFGLLAGAWLGWPDLLMGQRALLFLIGWIGGWVVLERGR